MLIRWRHLYLWVHSFFISISWIRFSLIYGYPNSYFSLKICLGYAQSFYKKKHNFFYWFDFIVYCINFCASNPRALPYISIFHLIFLGIYFWWHWIFVIGCMTTIQFYWSKIFYFIFYLNLSTSNVYITKLTNKDIST